MPVQIRKKIEAGRLLERAFLPGFRTLLIVCCYQSVTSDRCIRNNRNRIRRATENIPLTRSRLCPAVGCQRCIQIEVTENIIPVILPRPVISILSMNACPAARRNNITLKITLITDCSRAKLFQISRALDGFGIPRESYFANNGKDETFMDILLRYGNKYQMDKSSSAASLFGDDNFVAIAKPEVPHCERWSDLERLNKEKELVGIYLSAHPLDEYRIILNYVCNTGMTELEDKDSLAERGDILLGGIVTGFREGMTKTGKPYGILRLEDFTGSGEIALFGQNYIDYAKYGKEGMYLLISGKMEPRKYKENVFDFNIASIKLLQDEKDKLIENISITLPIHDLDEQTVNELTTIIHNNPGNSLLYFKVVDGNNNISLNLFSRSVRLNVTKELVDYLTENEIIDFKING